MTAVKSLIFTATSCVEVAAMRGTPKRLGKGSFGAAWKMWDQNSNRYFVKKSLVHYDCESREALRREIEIHRTIPRHQNIVEYYGYTTKWYPGPYNYYRGTTYKIQDVSSIHMEFLNDGDMWSHMKKGGKKGLSTLHKKVAAMIDILKGLEHLHEQDIVHMDIKPENIAATRNLKDNKQTFKLIDFGFARSEKQWGGPGTWTYCHPDIKGFGFSSSVKVQAEKRYDIYAAGVVFFEMIWGVDMWEVVSTWRRKKGYKNIRKIPVSKKDRVRRGMSRKMKLPSKEFRQWMREEVGIKLNDYVKSAKKISIVTKVIQGMLKGSFTAAKARDKLKEVAQTRRSKCWYY